MSLKRYSSANFLRDIDMNAYENQPNENTPISNVLTNEELNDENCMRSIAYDAGKVTNDDKWPDIYKELSLVGMHKSGNGNSLVIQDARVSRSDLHRQILTSANLNVKENNNEGEVMIKRNSRSEATEIVGLNCEKLRASDKRNTESVGLMSCTDLWRSKATGEIHGPLRAKQIYQDDTIGKNFDDEILANETEAFLQRLSRAAQQQSYAENLIKNIYTVFDKDKQNKKKICDAVPKEICEEISANENETFTYRSSKAAEVYSGNNCAVSHEKYKQSDNKICHPLPKEIDGEILIDTNNSLIHELTYKEQKYLENLLKNIYRNNEQNENDTTSRKNYGAISANENKPFLHKQLYGEKIYPKNIYAAPYKKFEPKKKNTYKEIGGAILTTEDETFLHRQSYAEQTLPEYNCTVSYKKNKQNEKKVYDTKSKEIDEANENETFIYRSLYAQQLDPANAYVLSYGKNKRYTKNIYDTTPKELSATVVKNGDESFIYRPTYTEQSYPENDNETFIYGSPYEQQLDPQNAYVLSYGKDKRYKKNIYDTTPKELSATIVTNEIESFTYRPTYAEQTYPENDNETFIHRQSYAEQILPEYNCTVSYKNNKQNKKKAYGTTSIEIDEANENEILIYSSSHAQQLDPENAYVLFYGKDKRYKKKIYDTTLKELSATIVTNGNEGFIYRPTYAEQTYPENTYAASYIKDKCNEKQIYDTPPKGIDEAILTNDNETFIHGPSYAEQMVPENMYAASDSKDKQNKQDRPDIKFKDIFGTIAANEMLTLTPSCAEQIYPKYADSYGKDKRNENEIYYTTPKEIDVVTLSNENESFIHGPRYAEQIDPQNIYAVSDKKDKPTENKAQDTTPKEIDGAILSNENVTCSHKSSNIEQQPLETLIKRTFKDSASKDKQNEIEIYDTTPKEIDVVILSNENESFIHGPRYAEQIDLPNIYAVSDKKDKPTDTTPKEIDGAISSNENVTCPYKSPSVGQKYLENIIKSTFKDSDGKDKQNEKEIYDTTPKEMDVVILSNENESFIYGLRYAEPNIYAVSDKDKPTDTTPKEIDGAISSNENVTCSYKSPSVGQKYLENIIKSTFKDSDGKDKQNEKEIYDTTPKEMDVVIISNENESFIHGPRYAEQMDAQNIYSVSDKDKAIENNAHGTTPKYIDEAISSNENVTCSHKSSNVGQKYLENPFKTTFTDSDGKDKQNDKKERDSTPKEIGESISANEHQSSNNIEEVKRKTGKLKSVKVKNVIGNTASLTKRRSKRTLQTPGGMILKPILKANTAIKACKEKVDIGAAVLEDIQKCTTELGLISSVEKRKITSNASSVKTYVKKPFSNNMCSKEAASKPKKVLSNECNNEKGDLQILKSNTNPQINLTGNVAPINITLRDPLAFNIPKNPTEEYIKAIHRLIVTDSPTRELREVIAKNSPRKAHSNLMAIHRSLVMDSSTNESKEVIAKDSSTKEHSNQIRNCNPYDVPDKINNFTCPIDSDKTTSKEMEQSIQTVKQEQDKGLIAVSNYKGMYKVSPRITRCTQTKRSFILNGLIHYDITKDEFVINCVHCMKTFPLCFSFTFQNHVQTAHSNKEVSYNDQDLSSEYVITDIPIKREINSKNVNKDIDKNQLFHVSNPTHIAYISKEDEDELSDKSKYVEYVLHNIGEAVNDIIIPKTDAPSFMKEAQDSRSHSNIVNDNNSQKILTKVTRKNRKRKLNEEDDNGEIAAKISISPVVDDKTIFPLDVEEDDIPKPTNGDGIIFGVTNRAVVMHFLEFFKTHPKLWKSLVLQKSLGNYQREYLELEELCAQLNEKWDLNITAEEVAISLERIMRWLQTCLTNALFNAQIKVFSGEAYSEYFNICLQISQSENIFTEEIKSYLNFRQSVLHTTGMPKITCKDKDNPILCDVCGKLELSPIHLARHKKCHQSPQNKCTVCPKMFYETGVMEQHVKSQHLNMLGWMCEICGKTFRCQSYLHVHQKAQHWKVPYTCIVCGYTYNNQRNLTMHQSKYHIPVVGPWWDWVNEEPPTFDERKTGRPALPIHPEIREVLKLPNVDTTHWRKKYSSKSKTNENITVEKSVQNVDATLEDVEKLEADIREKLEKLPVRSVSLECNVCSFIAQHPSILKGHYFHKHEIANASTSLLYVETLRKLEEKLLLLQKLEDQVNDKEKERLIVELGEAEGQQQVIKEQENVEGQRLQEEEQREEKERQPLTELESVPVIKELIDEENNFNGVTYDETMGTDLLD